MGNRFLDGKDPEPIRYDWAYMIFKDKRHEQEGAPIGRIACLLMAIGKAIPRVGTMGAKSGMCAALVMREKE